MPYLIMTTSIILEDDDIPHIHDVILEITKNNSKLTDDYCRKVFHLLPDHIKTIAIEWGTSDTVFRDDMYAWLKKNPELLDIEE